MLSKMGYQAGQGIGRSQIGRAAPIAVEVKGGRQGLGVDENRKRKKQFAEQQQKERGMSHDLLDLPLCSHCKPLQQLADQQRCMQRQSVYIFSSKCKLITWPPQQSGQATEGQKHSWLKPDRQGSLLHTCLHLQTLDCTQCISGALQSISCGQELQIVTPTLRFKAAI